MIPVSLLLILVAVALLALGLTSGSSGLLITSIAASLLAAVALVIGARRNAGARRSASSATRPAAPAEPEFEAQSGFEAQPGGFEAQSGFLAEPGFDAEPDFEAEFAAAQASAQPSRAADFAAPPASEFSGPSASEFSGPPASEFSGPPAPGFAAPPAPDFSAPAAPPAAESVTYTEEPPAPVAASTEEIDFGRDEPPWRTRATLDTEVAAATAPDYDRAASAIHAARSESPDEHAWRRDAHAEAAAHAGLKDDFAEPDADDPDDEPLPQAVQPADAVRVARMDAEVLVVDGRPRYHVADCSHLVGRLTEPIPVNEAVELGFSPCGLCRPVDRLVAAAARR
ncbi:hypothetical protein ACIA5C_05525 [Actinoplanes sp. NPDC051343]|uniref:hypothetical protein n=1 Tax=Actinoplanes sp. NPDC051343 TaxID=3363906 RepID=UPI0037AD82C4